MRKSILKTLAASVAAVALAASLGASPVLARGGGGGHGGGGHFGSGAFVGGGLAGGGFHSAGGWNRGYHGHTPFYRGYNACVVNPSSLGPNPQNTWPYTC